MRVAVAAVVRAVVTVMWKLENMSNLNMIIRASWKIGNKLQYVRFHLI